MTSRYGRPVLVEHWFNGQWGWARRDIWLHQDGRTWRVVAQKRLRAEDQVERAGLSETEARALVDRLMDWTPGMDRSAWSKLPLPKR